MIVWTLEFVLLLNRNVLLLFILTDKSNRTPVRIIKMVILM